MIRTIKQHIYVFGLLPLAVLAVALVAINGLFRINEANRELANTQRVTASLLQSSAIDALVVGNVLGFRQTVEDVLKTSPQLVCVTLNDAKKRVVATVGKCSSTRSRLGYFPITASTGDFSDFKEPGAASPMIGRLGMLMNEGSITYRREMVIVQLLLSLSLIAIVLGVTGRWLRVRLVEPIQRIGGAMQALSHRDYSARVAVEGDDELARLADAINGTIVTIAAYTRELERRRNDADRALHDADEANLALGGLVRSLTEDLEEPMSLMHSGLTEIAIANTNPALRDRIKKVIALLQEAQTDFADLIDIATSAQGARPVPSRDLADILSDMQGDIGQLVEAEGISVNFAVTQAPLGDTRRSSPNVILLDLDGVRLRKALVYLIRAMGRRCKAPGVYVSAEFIRISDYQINISLHLKAFYEPLSDTTSMPWLAALNQYGSAPAIVGWTDRETKIIDYSLRAVGITPSVSASPTGAVSILLNATCRYTSEPGANLPLPDRILHQPISVTLISNDLSLMRLTTRSEMSNVELRLESFVYAQAHLQTLQRQTAVLIDMCDDIAAAMDILERLKAEKTGVRHIIAICPAGRTSEFLWERLFGLGFTAVIQKPLHYGRIIEVVRAFLSELPRPNPPTR